MRWNKSLQISSHDKSVRLGLLFLWFSLLLRIGKGNALKAHFRQDKSRSALCYKNTPCKRIWNSYLPGFLDGSYVKTNQKHPLFWSWKTLFYLAPQSLFPSLSPAVSASIPPFLSSAVLVLGALLQWPPPALLIFGLGSLGCFGCFGWFGWSVLVVLLFVVFDWSSLSSFRCVFVSCLLSFCFLWLAMCWFVLLRCCSRVSKATFLAKPENGLNTPHKKINIQK